MATKKNSVRYLITNHLTKKDFSEAWFNAFGDSAWTLTLLLELEKTQEVQVDLSLVYIRYDDMCNGWISFEGIAADGDHYTGCYNLMYRSGWAEQSI